MKLSRSVNVLVGQIKSGKQVNWYSWKLNDIVQMCLFYKELGWCKDYKSNIAQYEAFEFALRQVELKIKEILKNFLKRSWLKQFLIVHSVFPLNANRSGDWFVKFMCDNLVPTDDEVKNIYKKDVIPDDILDHLAIFDPRPMSQFEKLYEFIRIEYKFWGDPRKGESTSPINIIDLAWEKIELEVLEREEAKKEIATYDFVDIPEPF